MMETLDAKEGPDQGVHLHSDHGHRCPLTKSMDSVLSSVLKVALNLSIAQTRKKGYANSVDPVSSGPTLFIFFYFVSTLFVILFSIFVYETLLIEIMDTFNFIDGKLHFKNSGIKGLKRQVTILNSLFSEYDIKVHNNRAFPLEDSNSFILSN